MTKSTPDSTTPEMPNASGPAKGAKVMKWVVGATAVLSLGVGLQQLGNSISESRSRHQDIEQLMILAKSQESAGDFAAAWDSLDKAAGITGAGGDTQVAQANLAMRWLETRLGPDEERFDANRFLPVLGRAAAAAVGQRRADLLAHVGWAQVLRSDADAFRSQAKGYYREALQIDAQNVYANAMQGYWALWSVSGPRVADEPRREQVRLYSRDKFARALDVGRERDFVRHLQLNGLEQLDTAKGDAEFIAIVNGLRTSGEAVPPRTFRDIQAFYSDRLNPHIQTNPETGATVVVDSADRRSFLSALSPAEHMATFVWVFDRAAAVDSDRTFIREYYRAVLQEAAGQTAQALKTLSEARTQVPRDERDWQLAFDRSIGRLSTQHPPRGGRSRQSR